MDAEQLRERVLELEDLRARSRRLRLSRERLQPRLDRDRALLAERTRLRDAHQGDVDRLDRQGPHRWIASLDGSLDERRQRELAEAQEAAERVEEVRARLATLALEADQLDGDLAALGDTETPYQEALADLVLAARAGTPRPGVRGSPGPPPEEQIVTWAERRQQAIARRADVEVLLPQARALVPVLRRISARIPVVAAGMEASAMATDVHGAAFWSDGLGELRRQVAAADEAVLRLREEVEGSELPDLPLPDLSGFPSPSPGWRMVDSTEVAARMDRAQQWGDRVLAETEALVDQLLRLREELADA
ncbi:hypothetical protein AVL62_10695 [Serinicoccus chungangensis]|uniref:Uncharacterized protein n=1 Tax=Serinicoccus chungangensis TaxID=767452 RepID=A0A0W8IEJ2_9MICO|nr:hypothetical protein [Serinicoccus chungangensis]KUG58375.1 hypothetical protein AVL62_10695 [Serinicoccus chungangensis]